MEMNTRIQVEHPVTEMVTGVDLIKQQIKMHHGSECPANLQNFRLRGHSIECRINAEDPARNFMPSPGTVTSFHAPAGLGVRVDSHLYQGYALPIYYDSLVAKLIAFDLSREGAIRIMQRALAEFDLAPLKTTIPLHLDIMDDPNFRKGEFSTNFIERFVSDDDDDD